MCTFLSFYLLVCMFLCTFTSVHLSCPMTTAVSVEASTPRVPSRPCQGEAQYSAAKMRAPLSGLLARITLVTPLSPHTASCSTNNLSEDTERQHLTIFWQHFHPNLLGTAMFSAFFNFSNVVIMELKRQTAAQSLFLSWVS